MHALLPYNLPMPVAPYSLAIETTSRVGEIALGRADALLDTVTLPPQRRHHVGLMPGIEGLCRAHGLGPRDIGEVYVSLGPGSFTGLRVAVAAAKMLALAGGVKLVGVPTLDVVAHNAPPAHAHVAACLNLKRETIYCAVYRREGGQMTPIVPPALRALPELLHEAPRPVAVVGELLPEPAPGDDAQVTVLPPELARGRAEVVWHLGRALARAERYTDPLAIEPMYIRRPEAVELWERRHGPLATHPPARS